MKLRGTALGLPLARPTRILVAVASVTVGAEAAEEVTASATAADVTLDQPQMDALTASMG